VKRQPYPWVIPDLFRWFGLSGLSLVGLVVAWWEESGTASLHTEIIWLNVGVAAIVIGGLGNMTWLLQGRRAIAIRRRDVMAAVPLGTSPARSVPAEVDDARVAVPGATRHHRPGCAAVAGKSVESMSVAKHERAGRRPCGLCSG
jgi:hypothetical protein